MWPREHGTYGELGFPLLSALLVSDPTVPSWLLAAVSACFFLLHEPLLILRGARGARRRSQAGPVALRRMWLLLVLGVTGAGAAFVLGTDAVRYAMLVPAGLGGAVLLLALRDRERGLAQQLLAAAALVSPALPVAIAGGRAPREALWLALLWLLAFVLTTTAVRGVAYRARDNGARLRLAAFCLWLVLAGVTAFTGVGLLPGWLALCLLPTALPVLCLVLLPPHARHMRLVGWSLVASGTATLVLLLYCLARPAQALAA
jgi:hypothetical protein